MQTDPIIGEWYGLFLDLWNQRYRLEQQPREWLAALWKAFGGDPIPADEPSVLVTALLLRVRAEFVALDRDARNDGVSGEVLARLRRDALHVHDRWATVFRAERVPDGHHHAAPPVRARGLVGPRASGLARVTD